MSGLISWLNSWGDVFVLFTIRMLIQSSVLILILLLLDFVLRRRVRAVVRYWIWLLVLAKLVLPPSLSSPTSLVSWIGGRLPETTIVSFVPDLPAVVPEAVPPVALTAMEMTPLPVGANSDSPLPAPEPIPAPPARSAAPVPPVVLPTWQALVLLAWVTAVILMVVLLIQRVFFVRALLAQSREAPDALSVLLEQCRRHMGVHGVAGVRLTGLSTSPSVCGLLRPVILMPEQMARQLETTQLRSVLFHELAHIKRGDLWINLLQTLLQIVYLHHPLLWLANARIRAIREQAVDEAVLAALGKDAEEYPRTLLSISKLAFGPPALSLRLLGVVESKRALAARIRLMVSRPFPQNANLGLAGLMVVLVVGAALLPMARAKSGTSPAGESAASTAAPVVPAGSAGPDAGTPVAKTELESKPATERANPPEAGVTPRRPLEKQAVPSLNTWLRLNVIDQRVYVTDTVGRPFIDNWSEYRFKSVGLLSDKETLDHVRERLKDKGSLPIRIDVLYTRESSGVAEGLRGAIVKLAYENNREMQTEVRFSQLTWIGSGTSTIFLRGGKMRTLYPRSVQRPDGAPGRLTTGRIDPNDLKQHIVWRLMYPGNVPLTFRIEYDEASANRAKQVADTVKATAKELGIMGLVQIAGALVEPAPETVFLGRWQAITGGGIQTIDIQPDGVCLLTTGAAAGLTESGTTVPCPWTPITREIIIDVKAGAIGTNWLSYRGSVNADGNLVLERGVVYPQGSFHLSGLSEMIFQQVK